MLPKKSVSKLAKYIYFNFKLGQNSQTFPKYASLKNTPLRKETLYMNTSGLKSFSLDEEKPTEKSLYGEEGGSFSSSSV